MAWHREGNIAGAAPCAWHDELRFAGTRVAEVVTLGSPYRWGVWDSGNRHGTGRAGDHDVLGSTCDQRPTVAPKTARLRRAVRTVSGQPLYSAECFLPSPADAEARRYQHLTRLDGTDHQYEGREEVIAFVDAMLFPGPPLLVR